MKFPSGTNAILLLWLLVRVTVVHGFTSSRRRRMHQPRREIRLLSSYGGQDDQAVEALRSLADFHEGRWKGKARSFTVLPDTAAGIVQRKVSPDYEISVKLGLNSDRDYSLTETFSWDEGKFKARNLSLLDCSLDVDSVDASYSLDVSLPDLPSVITGTDKISQFAIEHCIAASEDKRLKCFLLYSMDQSLQRVVVCEETRVKQGLQSGEKAGQREGSGNQLTAEDLIEMQNDVDRLVEKLTANMKTDIPSDNPSPQQGATSSSDSLFEKLGQSMSSDEGNQALTLHDISLLELSSGVWLGDAIIRNNPNVPFGESSTGRGFGGSSDVMVSPSSLDLKRNFADWSVGVQKVAWRWMWNFGEEIRQVVDVGKAMGDKLADCLSKSENGNVCVNESLSRRTPKAERMVFIDWSANMVGFLVGPACIRAPRYLSFDQKKAKPFYTEFAIFQTTKVGDESSRMLEAMDIDSDGGDVKFPSLCFSKISRVYNHEGRLKQGSTSFYTFKRFGIDETD